MTWRLRIRHRTTFRYSGEVAATFNEARMTPLTDAHQAALHTRVDVRPTTATYRYQDYWGCQVHAFDVHVPHDELQVVATSVAETRLGGTPDENGVSVPPHDLADWPALADERLRDRYIEWLTPTARTGAGDGLDTFARDVATGLAPREAAFALCRFVHESIEYVPGATGVHSSVQDVWQERKGVCQDIAHVTVGLLRAVGIPARYVSGYLHPKASAEIGEPVSAESHAWVEWWDGGWTAYDPTNLVPAAERHVVVGRGREYGDVAPFKGLYSGSADSTLGVNVEVTRLA